MEQVSKEGLKSTYQKDYRGLPQGKMDSLFIIYGVSQKSCENPGNSTLLVPRLILFFSGCLTGRKINAAYSNLQLS